MIPKISVRPLATRNSSSPYWTAFRHWTREGGEIRGARSQRLRALQPRPGSASAFTATPRYSLFSFAAHLAQVDVLHRVVRPPRRERAARAVDRRLLASPRRSRLALATSPFTGQPDARASAPRRSPAPRRRRRSACRPGVARRKALSSRHVQAVGVVQRGEAACAVSALRFQRAVGEEAGAEGGCLLQPAAA